MKKLTAGLFIISISLIMSIFLAGCGGPAATPAPEPTPEPTTAPAAEEEPADTPVAPEEPELSGDPVRGGLLYDTWWVVLAEEAEAEEHEHEGPREGCRGFQR